MRNFVPSRPTLRRNLRGLLVVLTLFFALGVLHWHLTQRTTVLQTAQGFQFSPYVDVVLAIEQGLPWAGVSLGLHSPASIDPAALSAEPGLRSLILAFATGECGKESWGGIDGQRIAQANLAALQRANLGYIIATGGARAPFHCSSPQGMDAFVRRYASSHLLGFDFDIESESGITDAALRSLVREVRRVADLHPHWRFSFTIAASAAEGNEDGVNETGRSVLQAIEEAGLRRASINLMVMNYGDPTAGSCVAHNGRCDMVASAIRAVERVHSHYRIPYARIALTPMIGANDVALNVLSLEDALALRAFAEDKGLKGLHFWSLNRDKACPDPVSPASTASALCHGIDHVANLGFARVLAGAAAYPW